MDIFGSAFEQPDSYRIWCKPYFDFCDGYHDHSVVQQHLFHGGFERLGHYDHRYSIG
jgi:hypothetical protein